MAYPERLLNEGESVCVDVRPHWWYLAGPVFLAVVTIAGTIAAAAASVPKWLEWAAIVVMAMALLWLIARYVRWASTRLVVTTSRVIERRGVFSRQGREIPIAALSDIAYRQSFFERIIGAGNVILESAGRDSQEVFPDLPHPDQIHNEIYRQLEAFRRGSHAPAAAPAPASIPGQIEQLDQLRQRGVITEQEFQAKKAELLDRL
jgi:membrane protein YdbS with pleckstrin-like domain